ncbi:hypothetical protein [Thioalkalivibrio sp. HK1]|uniref:hypothetical protein n=1 Tax=Thioalkalivibrio sp. HK1 TaxID=1469245 RepID=UPI00046FE1E2|nr:hypothetical protein [Thioalkalivibrio sp. HK1]
MALGYKVEFILEDWMVDGYKSGDYIIRSGNLLEAQSNKVVKWLDVANITPPDEVEGMIGNAINFAKSAGSVTSVNFAMSTVNLALGVAIYHKLEKIENQILRCIDQLQQLFDRVNDIREDLFRGVSLYPILQGFELFDQAMVSSNREHLLQTAQIEIIKGMASANHWIQTRHHGELLEHFDLVKDIAISLVKATIAQGQIVRILNQFPTEASIVNPFEKALRTIDHLECKMNKKRRPRSCKEIESIGRLPELFECNKALKIAADESLNLQLALIQGETNIIEFDPSANKVKCLVHAPIRRNLLPPAS